MPKYTDPTTGKTIKSDTALTSDELEEAFGQLSPMPKPSTSPKTQPSKDFSSPLTPQQEFALPPDLTPEERRQVHQFVKPYLPIAGAVAGGAAGGPLTAGLGMAIGRQLGNVIDIGMGQPENVPSTSTGVVKQAAKDVALGTASEYGGQFLNKAISLVGNKLLFPMGKKLYESAFKIPPSVPEKVRQAALETGLEGKYLINQKGLDKLTTDIKTLNEKILDSVTKSSRTGQPIKMEDAVKRIDDLKDFYSALPPGRAKEYIDVLDNLKEQFLTKPEMTQLEAQKMKQALYALHKKHYGEMKTAIIEGDKAVARGLKEELVAANPELANLNAKDSALINLEEVLERAVHRTRNYDIVQLGDTILTTTGAVMGGGPGAAAGFITRKVLGDSAVKSRLAFALSKGKNLSPRITGRALTYPAAQAIGQQQEGQ